MTDEVAQNFTADTLLALGVSPAMVIKPEEVSQLAAIANALLVNADTLTRERTTVMRAAVEQAHHTKAPWMLDPVAVGALEFRRYFYLESLLLRPATTRGNASEVLALADMNGGGHDVGITNMAVTALSVAQALARQVGAIVVVAGEVDYATSGQRTVCVDGGDPLVARVVGTGCALSAAVAASYALRGDRLDNIASACSWMKQAGQIVTGQPNGPGSFVPAFLDTLYNLNTQEQV